MRAWLAWVGALAAAGAASAQAPAFRPPAVPLVAHDPYFSCWSMSDRLTDDWPKHWTGSIQAMSGLIRIDGKPFRYMGPKPEVPAMAQTSVRVTPTQSIYSFDQGGTRLVVTFTTPALTDDLDLLSRPLTYVTWELDSSDGRPHQVELYFDVTAEWCVDKPTQLVRWARETAGNLTLLRFGSKDQAVLAKAGDSLRIDWGQLFLGVPGGTGEATAIASDKAARNGFLETGKLPTTDDPRQPRAANDDWPVLSTAIDFGAVTVAPVVRHAMLMYDDEYSIEYMGKKLRPWWRRAGATPATVIQSAGATYLEVLRRCRNFDEKLLTELEKVGGTNYSRLAGLVYRQCLAAHKLVASEDGQSLYFSKENFSNGCIDTVDVTYPSAPFFLFFQPKLLRAQLVPILDYAASERWKFPFAPHDLGTYPKANGQVYGGGEKSEKDQMPVEECGNMLILVAALAKAEGDTALATHYWPTLTKWANYLKDKGLDPENQLCTDDFAGHLAHNTNLSIKAIIALGCYATLCDQTGQADDAKEFRKLAQGMAKQWATMADDGDHFRLTFDRPGTWSQKYNLVWDKLLGLNLFPPDVASKEIAYYKKIQDKYGLPLDNRKPYTKLDWIFWTATLAQNQADFEAFVDPVYAFAQDTPSRVPLTDWYWTKDAKQAGFQARSVVGGVFIKLLADKWEKERK